jgi:ribosomal protein S27E
LTIQAKSDNGKITDTFKVQGTVETAKIVFKSFEVSDTEAGSKATIKLVVANDGDVEAEDLEIKFYDKGTLIKSEKIDNLDKRDQTEVQFTYEITEGDHDIRAETSWSDKTIKDTESFSSESEFLSGNMLWIIIIIVAVVVFIIGVGLASVSYRSGIPPELREEIAMAKQASKMGKSPDEIRAMRRKRYEGPGALGEKKKPGFKPEKEMDDTGVEEEREKPKKKSPGKVTRIKCPKCDKVQTVTSTKRPIEFPCSTCGMKLVLKK